MSKGRIRKKKLNFLSAKGFWLFDMVETWMRLWDIHRRRTIGSFVLKTLSGEKLEISPNKIKFIAQQYSFIAERRTAQAAAANSPSASYRSGGTLR